MIKVIGGHKLRIELDTEDGTFRIRHQSPSIQRGGGWFFRFAGANYAVVLSSMDFADCGIQTDGFECINGVEYTGVIRVYVQGSISRLDHKVTRIDRRGDLCDFEMRAILADFIAAINAFSGTSSDREAD